MYVHGRSDAEEADGEVQLNTVKREVNLEQLRKEVKSLKSQIQESFSATAASKYEGETLHYCM